MKTKLTAFAALLSSVAALHLCASDELQSKIELGQGYRHDRLKVSIAGPKHHPNILSEIDFKNLQVYLTTLKASLSNDTYIAVVDAAYGDIVRGKERDSEYFKDNKHGEISRSRSKIRGEYTVDATAKIGRIFPMFLGVTFTPSIGYGAFWQHLRIKHPHQIIPGGDIGRKWERDLRHQNNTYKTFWGAPFVDTRLSVPLNGIQTLDLGYTFFYPIQYIGKGNWNIHRLRFTQKNRIGKSYAQKGDIGLRWALSNKVEFGINVGIARFTAKDGKVSLHQYGYKGHVPARRAQRTFVDYLLTLSYAF